MRKELLVVLPVVKVSEVAELSVVTTAGRLLLSRVVELTEELTSPIVDPATVGTAMVPKTSVWLCVSIESAEVSSGGFLLTVTHVSTEVRVWATVVSISVILGTVPSRVLARAGVPALDRIPGELVVLGIIVFASVDGGKVDTSEVDKAAIASVGRRLASGVPEMVTVVSISVTQVVSLIWVTLKATKPLPGVALLGPRTCEPLRTPAELSEEELLSEDRCSTSVEACAKVRRSTVIFLASSELSSVQSVSKMAPMASHTGPVWTVLISVLGLPLGANVSVGMV